MKKNIKKILLLSLSSMTMAGGVISIASCKNQNEVKPSSIAPESKNKAEKLPADYTGLEYASILDLTVSNVIEDAIPKFVEQLLNNALEILFTSRGIAIYNSISKGEITSAQLQDAVAKETFNKIYHLPLVVKIDKGQLHIPLGDLLLELLGKEEGSNPLLDVLKDGTSSIGGIVTAVSNAFDNSDEELGPVAFGKLLQSLTPVLNGGSQALLDSLKAVLPKLDVSFSMEAGSINLAGLVDKIQNKIINNFDKITEMQGKTFEEIADSPIYRGVAMSIFGMNHAQNLIDTGLGTLPLELQKQIIPKITNIYKALSGHEVSKEEFMAFAEEKLFATLYASAAKLPKTATTKDLIMSEITSTLTPSKMLGLLIGHYIDIKTFNIPELEFGRGAGQLGDNEKLLATKLAQLIDTGALTILGLFGLETSSEKTSGLEGLLSIVGLYSVPLINGSMQASGLTVQENEKLIRRLYAKIFSSANLEGIWMGPNKDMSKPDKLINNLNKSKIFSAANIGDISVNNNKDMLIPDKLIIFLNKEYNFNAKGYTDIPLTKLYSLSSFEGLTIGILGALVAELGL